jgi:hypothetical protein
VVTTRSTGADPPPVAGRRVVGADVDPDAVAGLLLPVILGFIAQRSLAGGASIEAHVAAVTALLGAPAR